MHEQTNFIDHGHGHISFEYRGYKVQYVPHLKFLPLNWCFESPDVEREWRMSKEAVIEAIDEYEDD